MSGTYYQWLAESIVMTDRTMVGDILSAIDHALKVPGHITPVQADRLGKLAAEIEKLTGKSRESIAEERIRRAVAS